MKFSEFGLDEAANKAVKLEKMAGKLLDDADRKTQGKLEKLSKDVFNAALGDATLEKESRELVKMHNEYMNKLTSVHKSLQTLAK